MATTARAVLAVAAPQGAGLARKPAGRRSTSRLRALHRPQAASLDDRVAANLAAIGALLGPAGAAYADTDIAAVDTVVAQAVAAAEAAVEKAEEVIASANVSGPVATAVQDAAAALDAAVQAEAVQSVPVAAVASDLVEAKEAIQEAVVAAAQAGTDISVVEAVQQAATAIQEAAATVQLAAQPALNAAGPVLNEVTSYLAAADAATLAQSALGVVAVTYVAPPLAKASADKIRGYAGDMLPTTVFDALVAHGGNVLIDIRTPEEKEAEGVPDLPNPSKGLELALVRVGDGRLEERLRDASSVEAESTAIQIAALKQLSRGLTVYLLDSRGGTARAVARELTKRGWRRVFVVAGGCQSWTAAKLRIKPWHAAGLLMAPLEHKDEPVPLDVVA